MLKPTASQVLVTLLSLASISCSSQQGGQSTFHDSRMDFGLIQRVAVLPFTNLSQVPQAAERVRDVFSTMLQASVELYVIPKGEVERALSRVQLENPAAPSTEEVINLAANLEADVLFAGTVLEYGPVRSAAAEANVISISAKMFEGQTGSVVWSASATRGGIGASERLIGGGGRPMNIVTSQAVESLLDRLVEQ